MFVTVCNCMCLVLGTKLLNNGKTCRIIYKIDYYNMK